MVSGFVKDLECLIERIPKELPVWRQLGRGDPQCAIAEANLRTRSAAFREVV